MDVDRLKKEFRNPSNTYRLAPFWFLNHDLKDSELIWQIEEMHRNGVGGFIAHPRHGLTTLYLSDDYMDRIETCVKEADRRQMKAYLYDENNWPSGTVDGKLVKEYPEYRMSGCNLSQEWIVQGGKQLREQIEAHDGIIAIVAVPLGRSKRLEGLPESVVSLTTHLTESTLKWTAPAGGRWQVMVFTRKYLVPFGFWGAYLDTMSESAVAKFIEMTHERYSERFSEYFGGTVPGIFTDEPNLNSNPTETAPWTQTLPAEFGWRHGYDIIGALPAVFKDAGAATDQLRCDFFDTATHLYAEAFFKQTQQWCESRRLNFVGHVSSEGELYWSTKYQGDFFRSAKYMSFGGVDFLTAAIWPNMNDVEALNNLVGPKLASSAAHIYNKPRVMSEAFGLAKVWEIDLRTLRWMTDWQIALGVNLIAPHAFYYSIQGFRKWECPPGQFYQSTFWPYYKIFADYTARLCAVLSGGFHVADVAVVFPARSMWAAIDPSRTPEADRITLVFNKVAAALLMAGYDFDILPEESLINDMDPIDLEHCESLEQYKAIVVPGCTTILEETADFLNTVIENGSTVIFCEDTPKRFVSDSASRWPAGFLSPEVLADQIRVTYDWKANDLVMTSSSADEDALSALVPDVASKSVDQVTAALSTTLKKFISADVTVSGNDDLPYVLEIIHCHYQRGENDFFFFANSSLDKEFSVTAKANVLGVPAKWDATTGEVRLIEDYEFEDEHIKLVLSFKPGESHLISVTPMEIWEPAHEAKHAGSERVTKLADEWDFKAITPNALPLARWEMKMGGASENSWGYGWRTYTTEFESEIEPKSARLLLDGLVIDKLWNSDLPVPLRVTLNDEVVSEFEEGEYLDHLIKEADVSGLIRRGTNKLTIWTHTDIAPAGNLTEPAYLVGDFALSGGADAWRLVSEPKSVTTGSWTDQGYPFLSGTGSYTQKVTLNESGGRVILRMDKPSDMAEVIINDKPAGVLPWEPWEVDITEFVKQGVNKIEIRVTNSLANLFAMDLKPSGLVGRVQIVETGE